MFHIWTKIEQLTSIIFSQILLLLEVWVAMKSTNTGSCNALDNSYDKMKDLLVTEVVRSALVIMIYDFLKHSKIW